MNEHPKCYNRPPHPGLYVANAGLSDDGRQLTVTIPWAFEDRCTMIDTAPNGENYARDNGFNCEGCRWNAPVKTRR